MLTFTLSTEILTSKELKGKQRINYLPTKSGGLQNSEVIDARMGPNLQARLNQHADKALYLQGQASFRRSFASLSKSVRMILQSFVLGLGAFLALRQEISQE